jgi:hypothetical protein
VSFVDAFNQSFDPDLSPTTFVPTLRAAPPDPTEAVQQLVGPTAGAGKLGI